MPDSDGSPESCPACPYFVPFPMQCYPWHTVSTLPGRWRVWRVYDGFMMIISFRVCGVSGAPNCPFSAPFPLLYTDALYLRLSLGTIVWPLRHSLCNSRHHEPFEPFMSHFADQCRICLINVRFLWVATILSQLSPILFLLVAQLRSMHICWLAGGICPGVQYLMRLMRL